MAAIQKIIKYRLLSVFLLSPLLSIAQVNERMDFSVSEKIYLQLGSGAYATDQVIWFKAIVLHSENHLPSNISALLYVDLINPDGKVIEHKLTKLTSGIGYGSFELNDNYSTGRYLIKAYTQWNRNFGNDFVFKNYIRIVGPKVQENKSFLDSLTTIEKESGEILLTGRFNHTIMEAHGDKRIPVYIDFENGRDTINIKKRKNYYPLAYEVPKNINWATLTLKRDTNSHSEIIVLKKDHIDLQFFPEGGQLVHGFTNKIGFKALGLNDKGIMVHGSVLDEKGEFVTDFTSNHLGMGTLRIKPDSTKKYHAKIHMSNNSTKTNPHNYSLPEVISKGSSISLSRSDEKLWIRIFSNQLEGKVYIKISCRGKDFFLIEGPLQNGYLIKDFLSAKLPRGIIVFTLMDGQKRPVAERLFFNQKKSEALNISLKTNKQLYESREMTKLSVQVLEKDSLSKGANLSVLAINKAHLHENSVNTIRSYFLLDSELRGEIENPDYYFKINNSSRFEDLDALLLTQGWRNYKYPINRQSSRFFLPQKGIEVKGFVQTTKNKQKTLKNINVNLAAFGKETIFYKSVTDSLGHFRFILEDDYGSNIPIFLNTVKTMGNKTLHKIRLDTFPSPKVIYKQKPFLRESDTIIKAIVEAEKERVRTSAIFDSLYGVTQLDEVVVSDYFLSPERAKLYRKFGKPDVIISGEEIREKEKKWSYGLYSILLFNYHDQVDIEQFPDGFMLAHIRGGRGEPTLLMVDGQLLQKHQYEYVSHMSPKIVERLELIKYAKFFKSRYLTVFPETDPLEAPNLGHIISITTKGGVGIHTPVNSKISALRTTVDMLSPIKEFYAPKHNKSIPTQEKKIDLRSLLHWEPNIFTNQIGSASTSFYNCDVEGNYIIIVEAISKDGRIGYGEMEYSVLESSH